MFKLNQTVIGKNSFITVSGKIIALYEDDGILIRNNQNEVFHFCSDNVFIPNKNKELSWEKYL